MSECTGPPPQADRAAPQSEADAALIAAVRLSKMLHVARTRHSADGPVDTATFAILFAAIAEPLRTSDIACIVHSDASTVSRQVSTLVERGLAERIPDPNDGRAHLVRVTDAGQVAIAELRAHRTRFANNLLHDWSDADVTQLRTALERFGATLEHHLTDLARNENA